MDWFVKAFLKASLVWLGLGVTAGIAMAVHPAWEVYYPAHVHMNLLGFVTMMIYGVAYHVVPRFVGRPLHDRRLAVAHWWASNSGLALMIVGLVMEGRGEGPEIRALIVGGTLSALGAYAFIYNIWYTLDAIPRLAPAGQAPALTVMARGQRPRVSE